MGMRSPDLPMLQALSEQLKVVVLLLLDGRCQWLAIALTASALKSIVI